MKTANAYLFFLALVLTLSSCKAQEKAVQTAAKAEQQEASPEQKRRNAQLFADGVRERLIGNHEKAFVLFEQALEADPNDHASMYELAELHANKGNIGHSLKLMEKAIGLEAENTWYLVRIAQIYKHIGDYNAYAEVFKKLSKMYPTNPEYFSELSSALVLQGKYEEAIQVYEQIENQIGINEILSLQKHGIYLMMDQSRKAVLEIEKLADANPYETRYQAMLAELYIKYGPKEKAMEAYNRIKLIDPDDPFVNISISEYYSGLGENEKAFSYLHKAFKNENLDVDTKIQVLVFWLRGNEEQPELEKNIKTLVTALVETHPQSARAYHMLAEVQYRQEEFELARDNFLKSISLDSSVFMVWENLLLAHVVLFDFEGLERDGKRTIELFPEQPVPYYFTAVAKFQNKNYEEALRVAETGRRFVVGNERLRGEFFAITGDIQQKLGNHAASDQAYDRALAVNPMNSTVLNNYAYYLSLRRERLTEAEEMSRRAVDQRPDVPAYLDTYAWIMYKKGNYTEARTWLEKALEHIDEEDDNAVILEHYGDILYKLGEKEKALEYWKKALEAGEASEFIEKKVRDGKLYE